LLIEDWRVHGASIGLGQPAAINNQEISNQQFQRYRAVLAPIDAGVT
jgi:hypothetical protein